MAGLVVSRLLAVLILCACLPPRTVAAPGERPGGHSEGAADTRDTLPTTVFRGRSLSYEVVGDLAVHGGDMVLGTAEEVAAAGPQQVAPRQSQAIGPEARALSPIGSSGLWQGATVPYVIDAAVPGQERLNIQAAIREWNTKTAINLVARTNHADFVRFKLADVGTCLADVGRRGGEQSIYIPQRGCRVSAYIHEIGHAIGLWHEHQREDRDQYLMVLEENLRQDFAESYRARHPADGPFDFASVMNYSVSTGSINAESLMETIPPGMTGRGDGLSQGDIHGVGRIYGSPQRGTLLSTNPEGLEIVVDGLRRTAPVRLNWSPGSSHTIESPVSQLKDGSRYLFGRWNVGGERRQTVVAGEGPAWIEANFIVQHPVATSVVPARSGTVTLTPASPDGFYTLRTPVQAVATAATPRGPQFWFWAGLLYGYHGPSSNPASWIVDRPDKAFQAYFTERPLLRISAAVEPFFLYVDGELRYAPLAVPTDDRRSVRVGLDAARPVPRESLRRYRFKSWSDRGELQHEVTLPRRGGTLTADVAEEVRLTTRATGQQSGTIVMNPAASDGFYERGSTVNLTAAPRAGWEFVRWKGSDYGFQPTISIVMDRPKHIDAEFSRTRELRPGVVESLALPASRYNFRLLDRESGFRIHVPRNASEVEVKFVASTSRQQVDVIVNANQERVRWMYGPDGRTPRFMVDHRSADSGTTDTVVISSASTPPLVPGEIYNVALLQMTHNTAIDGALTARVKTNPAGVPSAYASPRAFTFVLPTGSDVQKRTMRVTNRGSGILRFRIATDRPWLAVTPHEGTIPVGQSADLELRAAAAGLQSDTLGAELELSVTGLGSSTVLQRIDVPVTLVVVPK